MRFAADERLGLASGTCYEEVDGSGSERHVTGDHVWGAARAYRREVLPIVMPLEPHGMGRHRPDQGEPRGLANCDVQGLPFFHHRPGRRT